MPGKSQPGTFSGQPLFSKQFTRQLRDMISFGAVANWYYVGVRCHNQAVGTTTEDIWEAGGVQVLPSAAGVASVVSSDADDTAAGTGARTVTIEGLDADYEEISEVVTLNGITPVNSTNSYLRVNSLVVSSSGTSRANEGNITVSVGGNVQRYISVGSGICHCSQYTIPANHTAYLVRIQTWQGRDSGAESFLQFKDTAGANTWITTLYLDTYRSELTAELDGSIVIPAKADIRMQAFSTASTVDQGAYYVLYLNDNR